MNHGKKGLFKSPKLIRINRTINLKRLDETIQWDVIIIGGGASGLGVAVDGGVRYLQNGDVSLVIEALKERGIMRKNAPHLVRDMSFVIPSYDWWTSPFYGLGLKIYDMMSGKLGLGPSTILDQKETISLIPNVNKKGLKGGVIYQDGQFDDARMAISLALTASQEGACLLNYINVIIKNFNFN